MSFGVSSTATSENSADVLTGSDSAINFKLRNKNQVYLPGSTVLSPKGDLTIATDQGTVRQSFDLANTAINLVENSATVAAGSTADALSNQNDLLQKFLDNQANAQSGGQADANKSFIKLAAVAVLGLVVIVIAIASIFKPHKA